MAIRHVARSPSWPERQYAVVPTSPVATCVTIAVPATREGDKDWGEQDIAARLAAALFQGFPLASDSRLGG